MSEPGEKWVTSLKNEFLECPVCVEHFNQTDKSPRLLKTCLHAFCSQCIDQLLKKEGRGQLTCPMCRHVEKVKGKATSLPEDPVRSKLVDFLHMKRQKKIKCTDCPDGHDADGRCDTCQMYLCKECINAHKRHHSSRDHHITSIEEALQVPIREFSQGHFCPKHPKQHIDFYCTTDEELCCVSCTVIDHKGHEFEKIQDAAAKRTSSLLESLQDVNKTKTGLQQRQKALKAKENAVEQMNKESERNINKMIDNMKLQLDQGRNQLLYELQQESSAMLSAIEKSSAAYDTTLAIVESTDTYFAQAKEKADDVEMLQMYPAIKRSVDALQSQPVTADLKINEDKVKFSPTQKTAFDGLVSQLGTFGRQDSPHQAVQHIPAVGGILGHKPHTVSGQTFDVTAFYDDLGPVKQVTPQTREETFRFLSQGEVLLMRRLVEGLETEFNLQEVTVKDLEVRLKGDHSAVSSAMEKLRSTLKKIEKRDVRCFSFKAEYLNSPAGRKEMIAVLDRKGVLASWICQHSSITIYGLCDRDVSVTESTFENDLKKGNFDDCPHFDKLNDHLENLFDKNKFRLCRKTQCYLAQKDIFSDMKREIESFLEQSKPKETQHVSFSPEEHKFLHIVMREHMIKFRRDLQKHHDVEIQDSEMKISVYGHQKDIRHVCEALEGFLKDNMKRDQLHLDSKESERFQKVTNGNHLTLFKHIEDTRKCIIKMEEKTVSVITEDDNLGAVRGSYGSEKGSYGDTGGSYGATEGSYGATGGSYGATGGSYGATGGSYGATGGSYGATGGSYGATGGSYGATGGSYGADRDGHFYRKQNDETGNNWQTKERSGRKNRKFVHDASSGNSKKTGLKISLVEGEIAKTDADVSVNVTSGTLDLEFGAVSKSFKKEGGADFVKECKSYAYKSIMDFKRTGGGKLKCKHVLHCCLPLRSDSSCEKKYKHLVRSMLKEVDGLYCKSIALPALGTGAFHTFEASWVAKTLYEVVSDFDKQHQPKHLKEVKFVVYPGNQDVVKAFRDMDKTWKAKHEDKTGSSTKIPGSSSIFPKVTVVSGELAEQKTEVIVNTSNSTLDLSKGAVSKSILDKAGPGIQSECYKWRSSKGSIHPGHFAVTNAGNMKDTKKLYHCHLPSYKHDTIKLLEDMLVDMLETAEQHHTKDIAFPALGTGVLKYPPREVAHAFFKAVITFQLNRKSSSLKEIRLVVYGADSYVLQTFKEEEKIFLEKSAPSANSTPTEPPAPDYDDRENSESSPGESGPLMSVNVGPFTVSVKHGDISKQRNTCIVNPINSNMSLKTGSVSKALGRVGGKEFEDKTKQVDYILREARVAFVHLHKGIGVIHLDRQYLEKSTVQAIVSCLKLSKRQKFDSISFPILLTGDAAQKMATDLYKALLSLDSMASVTAVNVSVVIYDKSQADVFCRKFASLNKGGNTEMRREETQIVFHLCSDTMRRLEYTKGALKGYAEDGRIVERINRPAGVTEDQISRVSRDYDDVNVKRNHGELELKGKPADVLKLLTALMQLFDKNTYENDDSPDENALFGDGQSGKFGQENPKKYSFTESTEENSWSVEKYTDKDTNKMGASHTDKNYGQGQDNSEKFSLPSSNYGSMEKGTVGGTSTSYQGKKDKYSDNEEGDASFRNNDRTGSEDIDAGDAAAAPYKMVWSFLDPDSEDLNPYDKEISRKIEMAYQKGEMLFSLPLDVEGSEYVIDFKMMVEYPSSDSEDVVPVLRREEGPEESSSIPNLPSTSSLKTSDGPYQRVKEHIKETRQDLPIFLVKIEKIENKEVYERFQWKKKTMKEGLDGATERLLWHRCVSTDSIVPINKHGMNLHFGRPAYGGPLGEGIELCERFTDILQHDTDRNQHAYLCFRLAAHGCRPLKICSPKST